MFELIGMIGADSLSQFITGVVRLLLAALCGGLIGMERGRRHRPAGLRTHMVVCIASALVMLTNEQMILAGDGGDMSRMGAQVISGIGFLGAGTILIDRQNRVRGLTTAAGLWASACIGLAIGSGYYLGGLLACALMLIVFVKFIDIEKKFVLRSRMMEIFVEFESADDLNCFLSEVTGYEYCVLTFEIVSPAVRISEGWEHGKPVAAHVSLWLPKRVRHEEAIRKLKNSEGLIALEEI